MTAVANDKKALRPIMRAARLKHWRALPDSHRALIFGRPPRMIFPMIADAEVIGLYQPVPGEVPTARYAAHLLDLGKLIALPWSDSRTGTMHFRLWSGSLETLEKGPWGLQPHAAMPFAEPQVLFMPLLAFDDRMNRLGQGGGHYDGWCRAHPDVRRIGLGWTVQQLDQLPVEPHDIPLDAVITEQQVVLPLNERPIP